MSLLSWFDNRTLLACHTILAITFATVFLGIQRVYPTVRGLRSTALAFLLGIPAAFAFVLRGSIPLLVSVLVGNLLILSICILIYDSIAQFTGSRRHTNTLWLIEPPVAVALWYWTAVHPDIVPRILIMSLIGAFLRGITAWLLFSRARSFSSRVPMRILGSLFLIQVMSECYRSYGTVLHGSPQNYFISNSVQTFALALNVLYLCSSALCFLFMVTHEQLVRAQGESLQDPLSGALNRRGIESRLAGELKRLNRSSQPLSIAFLDLDHFKSINDGHGHATGDLALRRVAEAVADRLRAYDSLGRFGGDEFLLLLPQTCARDAVTVTSRLSQAINQLSIPGLAEPLTLSIGITEAILSDDMHSLLARADQALYRAKHDGRNCRRVMLAGLDSEQKVEHTPDYEAQRRAAHGAPLEGRLATAHDSGILPV